MSVVATGRRLLIIGGGFESEARVRHALEFDWRAVDFVARAVRPEWRAPAEGDARFTFHEREPAEDDIRQADLVFEDGGDRALAEKVAGWCKKHRVPLNATDKPDLCDLFYSSFFVRAPVVVSVSSSGDAPAVCAALRRQLEGKVGPGWSTAARLLAATREKLPSGQARMDLLKGVSRNLKFLEFVEANDEAGMQDLIEDAIRRM